MYFSGTNNQQAITMRSEKASEMFLSGNNCSQSVVLSFLDEMNLERNTALRLAAGFGGGMGKQQQTCGAVSGSVMVLGVLEAMRGGDEDLKPRTYALVKEFFSRFEEAHKSSNCRELIGCDFGTEEGNAAFREQGIMEKVCAPCVAGAVRIIEEMML